MTNDAILKYVETKGTNGKPLNIHFKQRSTISGLFIQGNDYDELKSKNFWRIVSSTNLARIFNGMEFTRLSAE